MRTRRGLAVVCSLICLSSSFPLASSEATKVTRRDELVLEGIIHDFFYRNRIKENFVTLKFEAFATVSLRDIIITVHVKESDLKDVEAVFDTLKPEIQQGIKSTILDFADFRWAQDYRFTVNLRTGRMP